MFIYLPKYMIIDLRANFSLVFMRFEVDFFVEIFYTLKESKTLNDDNLLILIKLS